MNGVLTHTIYYVVAVSVSVFFIFNSLNSGKLLDNLSYTTSIVTILMSLYIKYLWRLNPLEKTPRFYGKYMGELISNYGTDKRIVKKIEILIRQDLLSVEVCLKTDETESNSISSNILCENGKYYLYYVYRSEPFGMKRKDNPVSYGSAKLEVSTKNRICGNYWTDRGTAGCMEASKEGV